ncbi:hypothetical protein BST95_00790 [Halioglobus japonicus]|uniref:FHA domain-containing protein n=1 Tax=Halioglobus japonicus TaxID=930805 RepID=A0AAP8MBS3_9GAMM|nr:hypothetical protein [Halioglobus japonicus]AQA16973.1 hypothetical protein BST95_00790 [Halioglobus japonicus]PLW84860.1 hypothetical protein C0029_17850 [Halioglobus japonicus]GHD21813.1 hypothetical protein GCM10007052_33040 [Halioglobus japonicus]
MSLALLDINDCNLRLWHGNSPQPSPGYALLQGKDYRYGADARAAARLEPRKVNTRYWWQLNTEPLQPPLGPARHTADLVHGHLLALHQQAGAPGELVIAAPATMGREQLSLLLGIAQQCPFEVVGLVNRSTLLASAHAPLEASYHLEIQLHQAVLCTMQDDGGHVQVGRSQALPGCGLLQLQERIVEVVAAQFIRQTRFDPRRKAASEQQLYNAIPELLRTLAGTAESNLEIQGYQARIGRDDLNACGEKLFATASAALGNQGAGATVLVEPLLALLPAAAEHLPGLSTTDGDSCWQAALSHGDVLRAGSAGLSFVDRLPRLATNRPAPASTPEPAPTTPSADTQPAVEEMRGEPESAPADGPSHLLIGSTATPLDPAGTPIGPEATLYVRGGQWLVRSPAPVKVNGDTWRTGRGLVIGDELHTADGQRLLLIEVRSAGA